MRIVEIIEGKTKLLVPEASLIADQPPKQPVFFNPKAKISRDIAILAYRAYKHKARMIDALAGIGARGLRAVNEVENIEHVYINDVNENAIDLAKKISMINSINDCTFSIEEANRLLANHSSKDARVEIVEIDPFGTPAYYIDNALRAIKDQGMICLTATDTPVLQGLYPRISKRRYYGTSLRVEYSNELGLRLILGMLAMVAARLELAIKPLFVHSIRNHLRIYAKVMVSNTLADEMMDKIDFVYHCFSCGNRGLEEECKYCRKSMCKAGPLWIDNIFDHDFVSNMLDAYDQTFDKSCKKILTIAMNELDTIGYYTIDEICKRLRITPPKLDTIIERLKANGFQASRTSLMPNGFRTNANHKEIEALMV